MKLKMRFDKSAIQQFFVENVEKIAFGVVVACSLFLIYRAVDRETFERTPTELINDANNLKTQIEKSPRECKLDLVDYVEKAEQSRTVVEEELYAYSTPWNPPLFEPPTLRSRPTLVPLAELRGAAGMGAVSVRTATDARGMGRGDSTTKGMRWVAITGLVPVKEQIAAYKRAFAKVKDYKPELDDNPMYVYSYVQRAEVGQGKPDAELEWKTVTRLRTAKLWETTGGGPEVVDPRYITPVNQPLVMSLPPVVRPEKSRVPTSTGSLWGKEVGHPKIKMARDIEDLDPGKAEEEEDVQEGPDFEGPDGLAARRGRFSSGGGMHQGMQGYGMGAYRPGSADNEEEFKEPDHLFYRFFDFTVQPGKHYVYRVRLMLPNPSSKSDEKFLDEDLAELRKQALADYRKLKAANKEREAKAAYRKWSYMLTDWCEPTEPIAVPRDTRLLAVSVTPSPRETKPPTAKLMVVKWMEEDGSEAYKEFPNQTRGKVLNFPDQKFPELSELRSEEDEDESENARYIRRARARADDDEEEVDDRIVVDYMSESILLDMLGGERLPGRNKTTTAPAKMVLLDPEGNLLVRDELEDLEQYEDRTMEEDEMGEMFEGPGPGYGPGHGKGAPGYDGGYFQGFE